MLVLRNTVVVLFLLLTFGLGTRSLVTDDARYGWAMFSSTAEYHVRYAWVFVDGTREEHIPGNEIQGMIRPLFVPGELHNGGYGIGSVRSWMKGYAKYMFENQSRENAAAFEVVIDYRKNHRGGKSRVTVQHP